LKILSNYAFAYLQPVVAYGFPSVPQRQELSARPGKVTGLLGPHNSIQVNAGLAPGMSGGPVVLEGTNCVVAVVAGGSDFPNYDYITPVQYARALLEMPPADFVSPISQSGSELAVAQLFDRSFRVDETYDEHEPFSRSSRSYDLPFVAETDATIAAAKLAEESAAAAFDKSLTIGGDRKSANFHFRLDSGPAYDQTRGWWHGQVILTEQRATPSKGPSC
jgi:hypothetical protein